LSILEKAKTLKEKIKSKRILIVDDEPDICLTIQMCLKPLGYRVDSYNDPVLALDNFKASIHDLVILDIKMPKMSGYQLYERMKEIDQDVKVCFMTAYEIYEADFLKIISESSVNCVIRKPVTLAELVTKIKIQLTN
jgi:two-component system, OmpR family, response regulator ChvI